MEPSISSEEAFIGVDLAASLSVKDLQASLSWYDEVLGFTIHQKHERQGRMMAVSLRAGDVRILITQDDGAKGSDRAKGEGFSLQITTRQNIDSIAKRITDRGGTLESDPVDTPWGVRMFRLVDPDGFRYTIASDPGPRPAQA
jgi:lactoylglutathione lyase